MTLFSLVQFVVSNERAWAWLTIGALTLLAIALGFTAHTEHNERLQAETTIRAQAQQHAKELESSRNSAIAAAPQPQLAIEVVNGKEPWDHPGYRNRWTKLVGVHNVGATTARNCHATVTGLEPLPQKVRWLNANSAESVDIPADGSEYMAVSIPEDIKFVSGLEVKVWVGDSAPVARSFDVTNGGTPFPWFNDHVGPD